MTNFDEGAEAATIAENIIRTLTRARHEVGEGGPEWPRVLAAGVAGAVQHIDNPGHEGGWGAAGFSELVVSAITWQPPRAGEDPTASQALAHAILGCIKAAVANHNPANGSIADMVTVAIAAVVDFVQLEVDPDVRPVLLGLIAADDTKVAKN